MYLGNKVLLLRYVKNCKLHIVVSVKQGNQSEVRNSLLSHLHSASCPGFVLECFFFPDALTTLKSADCTSGTCCILHIMEKGIFYKFVLRYL